MFLKFNLFDDDGDRLLRKRLISCKTSKQALDSHGSLGTKRGQMAWSRAKQLLAEEIISMNYGQTEQHLIALLGQCPRHYMYRDLIDETLRLKAKAENLSSAINTTRTAQDLKDLKRRYYHVAIRSWKYAFSEREHLLKFT